MRPHSLLRACAAVLCAVLLAGCSTIRIAYPHLDTYAAWTVDEYFELDAQQKEDFNKRFARLHAWHRYEQLPDYAAFLAETKSRINKGLTREDVLWVTEGIRVRYRTVVARSADDAAAMLMTVTPEQLDKLKKRWDKVNRRFQREYSLGENVEEQRRATGRRTLARIRDWVGHLDDAQEKQILAWAAALPLMHAARHQDRMRRQREFLQLMAQRDDPARFKTKLSHFLLNWEEGRDPSYDKLFNEWTQRQADLYVSVYRILLPHQRTAVADRIQGYINDLTRLARRSVAETTTER